jgi:hypothetical protein
MLCYPAASNPRQKKDHLIHLSSATPEIDRYKCALYWKESKKYLFFIHYDDDHHHHHHYLLDPDDAGIGGLDGNPDIRQTEA